MVEPLDAVDHSDQTQDAKDEDDVQDLTATVTTSCSDTHFKSGHKHTTNHSPACNSHDSKAEFTMVATSADTTMMVSNLRTGRKRLSVCVCIYHWQLDL